MGDPMNWLKAGGMKIHLWIWLYGLIIIVASVLAVFAPDISVESMFDDGSEMVADAGLDEPAINQLISRYASGSLTFVLLLIGAFVSRSPIMLATLFGFHFIDGTIDAFGIKLLELEFSAIGAGVPDWVIFSLPSIIAIWHLRVRNRR